MVLAFPAVTFFAGYLNGASLLISIDSGSLLLAPVLGALRHVLLNLYQVLHERESDVQVQHLLGRDSCDLTYVLFFLEGESSRTHGSRRARTTKHSC